MISLTLASELREKRDEYNSKFAKVKASYPRLNREIFTVFCYKEFEEQYQDCRYKLGLISALCDNSDHNAFQFVVEKLLQTKKKVKILMVLSDGQPCAECYEFIQYRYEAKEETAYDLALPCSHRCSW